MYLEISINFERRTFLCVNVLAGLLNYLFTLEFLDSSKPPYAGPRVSLGCVDPDCPRTFRGAKMMSLIHI